MKRIIIGMSGGVDSAVAALLLKQKGFDVIGVTLRTWDGAGSRCCKIDVARMTARAIGIPYHVINCASDFKRKVEKPFAESYLKGITPNPCVLCNREIKWEWMLYAAHVFQAEAVAAGHYAILVRLENGRYTIRKAKDRKKDQSYMLYRLTQEQLAKTVFPLGELTKEEVRHIARDMSLPAAESADSQEICFVTQGRYTDFIRAQFPDENPVKGNFTDGNGRILGRHNGIAHYTAGQRKGLGLALGYPVYVKSILPETNEIVVDREENLYRNEIICGDVHFLSIPGILEGERIKAEVKIRYRHKGEEAFIEKHGSHTVRVRFNTPVWAPAPGQSAVFYDDRQCVIGGGIILPEHCQMEIDF